MKQSDLNMQDGFYFYNAVIDPGRLIRKFAATNPAPNPGFITNAFGVIVDPKFFPGLLKGREGEVEPLPIPANWHADMAEFGAALRSVDLARNTFTMIELGCGWGCWMNNTGVAAKKKGLSVNLIGVEGDPGHVAFATEALTANGFRPGEYTIHHGIAASTAGKALFPLQEHSGASWGLEPLFDVSDADSEALLKGGKYMSLQQHVLNDIARDLERVDLLHVDIQGGEQTLIPSAMPFLCEKVAYLFIGTHSRQIEGLMMDCLLKAGWILEIERPAIISAGARPGIVVDGVQGWRNPRLLPTVDIADTHGSLTLPGNTREVRTDENFSVMVRISNQSPTDWQSIGETPVRVSYHWFTDDGSLAIAEGIRTSLAETLICAGETKEQEVNVMAPPSPGIYTLELTLVQEGIRWFKFPEFHTGSVRMAVAPRKLG